MNTVAKLFIDHKEWELNNTNISYYRETWANGKPSSETMGGMVTVSFTTRGDEEDILNWMFANRKKDKKVEYPKHLYILKKAEIVFYEGDYNGLILFKYKLEDCTFVYYNESFSNLWGMETTIVLSAAIQYYKNNDTFLIKGWRENWEPPTEHKPVVEEDKKHKLIYCYYTTLDGVKIENLEEEMEVYLVINTANSVGKTIDIDLNNKNLDFIYNGKVATNDIIKGVKITKDTHKVKLKTIKQQ